MSGYMQVDIIWVENVPDEQNIEGKTKDPATFDLQAVLDALSEAILQEKDESTFRAVYQYGIGEGAEVEELAFQTIWALQRNGEDISGTCRDILVRYKNDLDEMVRTFNNRDVEIIYDAPGLTGYVTGGYANGDYPTETGEFWSRFLFSDELLHPYATLIYDKLFSAPRWLLNKRVDKSRQALLASKQLLQGLQGEKSQALKDAMENLDIALANLNHFN